GTLSMTQSAATHPTWVQACQAHRYGDLATATRLYRQLVTQEPQHTDALYRLGCIAYTQGRPALARVYLLHAEGQQPTAAAGHTLVPAGLGCRPGLARGPHQPGCSPPDARRVRGRRRLPPERHTASAHIGRGL